MTTPFGSLLHAVLLAGMLVLVTFRPERIASRPLFHAAVVLLVVALLLPALAPLGSGPVDGWALRALSAASGVATALSIYCVLTCGGVAASRGS
jgi:hypothetical protein